jgi:hypothetical protein
MSGLIRQGDVLLVPCDAPASTRPVKRVNGAFVLAEGEVTGHSHRIYEDTCTLVSAEEANDLFLMVYGDVALVHDEHSALTVPPGTYRVTLQREYRPDEIVRVQD